MSDFTMAAGNVIWFATFSPSITCATNSCLSRIFFYLFECPNTTYDSNLYNIFAYVFRGQHKTVAANI